MEWNSLATQNYILVGSGIVIAGTLILLVLQVRVAIRGIKSQAYLGISNQVMELNQVLMTRPELYDILELESPTNVQEAQQKRTFFSIANLYETVYLQRQQGLIDLHMFEGWRNAMKDDFNLPGFKRQWLIEKKCYSKKFAQFIHREVIREGGR